MLLRRVGILAIATGLAIGGSGCSSGVRNAQYRLVPVTGYKEDHAGHLVHTGGALSVRKQDGGVYRIKVRSTTVSPPDRAEQMALMEAAQLARREGHSHVVIVSKKSGIMCTFQYGGVVSSEPRVELTVRLDDSLSEFAPDGFEVKERLPALWASVQKRDYTFEEKVKFKDDNNNRCYRGRNRRQ